MSGPLMRQYINLLNEDDTVDEMALSQYQTIGDFDKPGPFREVDKKLIPHPTNKKKAIEFFKKAPYDFRLFFSNIPGTGKFSEYGPMTPSQITHVFGKQAPKIIEGSGNAITIVYVGNSGDDKVMLTPWMMAHRFGHAVNRGKYRPGGAVAWEKAEAHFFDAVNNKLHEFYGKLDNLSSKVEERTLTQEYNALFNAIGTQRSSRSAKIRRPYEFFYELFAQYLGTGQIKLNPFPTNLSYGRKAWGKPTKFMNIKPKYRDEIERKHAADVLASDMEIMFDIVLSDSVGKIFVM